MGAPILRNLHISTLNNLNLEVLKGLAAKGIANLGCCRISLDSIVTLY